jgi:hypothetical protein
MTLGLVADYVLNAASVSIISPLPPYSQFLCKRRCKLLTKHSVVK